MVQGRDSASLSSAQPPKRLGVIDLGSNSIRLVVFDGPARVPIPLFNEKLVCALGRGTQRSGRLHPEGRAMALVGLARFVGLARAMKVSRLDVLATAAVRAASDGGDFVAEIQRRFGVTVRVLTGEEEAGLAALGIVCGLPTADGLMGDLGGGSLDLVTLDRGAAVATASASLPFGLLWLSEAVDGDLGRARRSIDEALARLDWLSALKGRNLFPVGGAWRTLASIAINQTGYPLHILDNYALGRHQAEDILGLIIGLSRKSLEKIPGVSQRRLETLPLAALLLERLLAHAKPARVVFSAYGMREGHFFSLLPPAWRAQDPLISACTAFACRHTRFALDAEELLAWTRPLFADESAEQTRLRLAACHLSDIAWADHPDYRSRIAFDKVLHLPFAGMTHGDRAMLALTVAYRYDRDPEVATAARLLLGEQERARARRIGLALRLGHTLTGGVPGLLSRTALKVTDKRLSLVIREDDSLFVGEAVERRLLALARVLDLRPAIVRSGRGQGAAA